MDVKIFFERHINEIVAMKFDGTIYNVHRIDIHNEEIFCDIDNEDGDFIFTFDQLEDDKNIKFFKLAMIED